MNEGTGLQIVNNLFASDVARNKAVSLFASLNLDISSGALEKLFQLNAAFHFLGQSVSNVGLQL